MGTSISQRSPRTSGWQVVAAGYRDAVVPADRLANEIWRAAQSQPDANWADLLSAPFVARCGELALQAQSPLQVANLITRELVATRQSSLATEIAKRAAIIGAQGQERRQAFGVALFSEVASYLVSRDLPGYVGPQFRSRSSSDALALKDQLRQRTATIVRQEGDPPIGGSAEQWRSYVQRVVGRLAGSTT